jgi:hypothetical protein
MTNPSAQFNFARSRLIDSRITFSRASTAYRNNQGGIMGSVAANVARLEHDPATLKSLGLLIEEQRTNYAQATEDIDNASYWTYANATRATNSTTAPDGTTTADTWTATAGSASTLLSTSNATGAGATVTNTFRIKKKDLDWIAIQCRAPNASHFARVFFNITTLAVGSNSQTGTQCVYVANSASVKELPNDWREISATFTTTVATTTGAGLNMASADGNVSSGISAGNGYYIWGVNNQVGAFPTSYIPATTAAVTRSADVATVTGSNFTGIYNALKMSMVAAFRGQATGTSVIWQMDDATANERITRCPAR